MGQDNLKLPKAYTVLLLVLLLLCGGSALPDASNVSTNKYAYNPGETVHITINHTSNITASVTDPYGSQTPLVLAPLDRGFLSEYSLEQGVILGTYTVQVFGENFSDSSMFKIRSLSIHPDINERYPTGNISLTGEVVDAESGNRVNASLDVTINNETINGYAETGDFLLNYSANTTGYKILTITAVDDENITGTNTAGFEVYSPHTENLTIITSQAIYEAGQNVDIRVVSGKAAPIVWVTDPLGISTSVKVSGKYGIYSGMYRLDKLVILGEYRAEAETENPADHVKAAFNVTAPSKLLTALQDAGVEFSRLLSGPRIGQHKVPPQVNIQINITAEVSSPVSNASFVDYYPIGWNITDPDGGTVDTDMNTITWDVGDVDNNVSRTYTIFSPLQTMPSTKYFFNTQLVYDNGSDMSKDWMVLVSNPDTEQPVITNILLNPYPQIINTPINVTANITDNINVSNAYINITLPNSTYTGNLSMSKNGGDLWYYNYTPPIDGMYNFTIYANNTADKWNSSTSNFTAQTPPNLTFTLMPRFVSSNIQTKFTLMVQNQGQAQAESVSLNLTVPVDFADPWIISDSGIFDVYSRNITWNQASLTGGSGKEFTFWSKCSLVDQFNFTANAAYQDLNGNLYNSSSDLSVNITARIAVYNGTGADMTSFNNIISKLEIRSYSYTAVDENDINNNNITEYDLLIIGSGSKSDMESNMGGANNGLTNIQTFVENGGGFIGFGSSGGGGSFLAGDQTGQDDLILTGSTPATRLTTGQCIIKITDTTHPVNNGYSGEVTIEFDVGTYFRNLPASTTELLAYYENIDLSQGDWNQLDSKTAGLTDQAGEGLVVLFGWDLLANNTPETDRMFENAINWAIRKDFTVSVNPANFTIHRNETKQVNVTLNNNLTYNVTGNLMVSVPLSWTAEKGGNNPITFNLTTNQTRNYIFNVTAYQGAFHANYTLRAYAEYQGSVSQDSNIAQIIGPGISISRDMLPLFVNPETNNTVILTVNNSALAEETARNLTVTEMVPSSWTVNLSSITPGAITWQNSGIFYIQWNLSDLDVGSRTSVSYEVRSPVKLLRYTFMSNATYLDEYNTLQESREYQEVTVVAAINFSAGTLIIPMDDKQSGNSTRNNQPRQLVAYGFLYNITASIPTMWVVQDVAEYFTANTTNVWNDTNYTEEKFSNGPFALANLDSTQQNLVIQAASYYNITLHNSTDHFTIRKGIITAPPRVVYYVPDGNPDQNNRGREDLILKKSLIGFTYMDKFDVLGGGLDNYDTMIVPSQSLQGTGPMESDVIDVMYDWLVAGGSMWISDEAAHEMVQYKSLLDLTPENFQRGGYGNLDTGNNLTMTRNHIITQTYGQVKGYPGWYDLIMSGEYSRTILATLEEGPTVMITGKEGSGEVFITPLQLYHDQVETASNSQGRRLINNFVFVTAYRSAARLEIIDVPPGMAAYRGRSNPLNITVKNTGGIMLNNVTLDLNTSLPKTWINITPYNCTYLDINQECIFTVNVSPPSGATPRFSPGCLEADSWDGAQDSESLPIYTSDLIVEPSVEYYNNRNQIVNIIFNVTNLDLMAISGADMELNVTAPDDSTYTLEVSEIGGGQYLARFNNTVRDGRYLVQSNTTKDSGLGYNFTYFIVEFLQVNFSFYPDSSYTTQSMDFDINDTIYIQTDVTYSNYNNYTNLSCALGSINVTVPDATVYVVPMAESSPGIYRGNFSTTQAGGDYRFYALVTSPNGITGSDTDTLTLPIYTGFPPGTLVIPMGPRQDSGAYGGNYPSQVSAYGLVHWLLANHTSVDWVILHDKAYDGFDFNADTDDDASNTTGNIADRNYSSGPFLIRDPDTGTSRNEAYQTIQQIRSDTGRYNDVVVHELKQTLYVDTRDDYILDRPARIAVQQTDINFIDYIWDTTLFPASPTAGMNMTALTLARIRCGDLLTSASVDCSRRKMYDWVFLDDDDFWDTASFPVGDDLFSQLDLFVNKTGHVHLQGKGVTMNTRTSWLTTINATYEEDDYPNKQQYSVLNSSADHPLAQTYGTLGFEIPLTFDAFEHDNNWRSNTLTLAGVSESGINDGIGVMWDQGVDNGVYIDRILGASEDNYAFVASNSYGGVTSALTGRKQITTPEMRMALDSVLFSVLTPQYDHSLNYSDIKKNGTSKLTVTGTVDSGMLVYDLKIYDELPTYVNLNNSSVTLYVPGSYTYHTSNNTLEFNLCSPNQSAILNGTLFSYEIAITPPPEQPTDLMVLKSVVLYDDNWNNVITSSHCITVQTINYISCSASKSITPGYTDNYSITLNLTSLVDFNQTNVNIFDLVPSNFSIVNSMPDYNGSQANRYYWTMNMTAGESRTITYNLSGTGLYRISDVFTVGVDPV